MHNMLIPAIPTGWWGIGGLDSQGVALGYFPALPTGERADFELQSVLI
jgi:hypothetical protein